MKCGTLRQAALSHQEWTDQTANVSYSLNVIILSHFILDVRGLQSISTEESYTTSSLPMLEMLPTRWVLPTSSIPVPLCPTLEESALVRPEDTSAVLAAEDDIVEEAVGDTWLQRLDLGVVE